MNRALLPMTLLAVALATGVHAQESSVSGSVVTPDGEPIRGYPVIVERKDALGSTQSWVSSTDSKGSFAVKELPPGEYKVAPANAPEAAKSFDIESQAGASATIRDLGTLEVSPGSKF